MTKIAVTGPASGTGTFTLTTPVSSSDRTLTFPDSTGTVLNDQSNIEAQVKTATNATGAAPVYACRSWVNFNGSGTVAIRASGNVSSITDNGVAVYTVNFTTAMPDANYAITGTAGLGQMNGTQFVVEIDSGAAPTTTSVRINVGTAGSADHSDPSYACVTVFR